MTELLEHAAEEYLQLPDLSIEILDVLPIAVLAVGHHGRIKLANRAAQLLTGYHRSLLLGQPVELLVPEPLRDLHATSHRPGYLAAPRERPMGLGRELRLRTQSGTEIPVSIELQPLPTPAGLLTVIAIVRVPRAG